MRIRKSLLLVSCLLFVSLEALAVPVHKKPSAVYKKPSANQVGAIKFGPHLGGVLGHGIFWEYALSNKLGVQISIGYLAKVHAFESVQIASYKDQYALAASSQVNVPVVVRVYPGEDRQCCWLIGFRVGYVAGAKFLFSGSNLRDVLATVLGMNSGVDMQDMVEKDKISRFQIGVVGGFDYELMGFVLGLAIAKDLTDILEAKQSWLPVTWSGHLGYNLGRFLE